MKEGALFPAVKKSYFEAISGGMVGLLARRSLTTSFLIAFSFNLLPSFTTRAPGWPDHSFRFQPFTHQPTGSAISFFLYGGLVCD